MPEILLGFEYQGEQHFKSLHWMGEFAAVKQVDAEKERACTKVHKIAI